YFVNGDIVSSNQNTPDISAVSNFSFAVMEIYSPITTNGNQMFDVVTITRCPDNGCDALPDSNKSVNLSGSTGDMALSPSIPANQAFNLNLEYDVTKMTGFDHPVYTGWDSYEFVLGDLDLAGEIGTANLATSLVPGIKGSFNSIVFGNYGLILIEIPEMVIADADNNPVVHSGARIIMYGPYSGDFEEDGIVDIGKLDVVYKAITFDDPSLQWTIDEMEVLVSNGANTSPASPISTAPLTYVGELVLNSAPGEPPYGHIQMDITNNSQNLGFQQMFHVVMPNGLMINTEGSPLMQHISIEPGGGLNQLMSDVNYLVRPVILIVAEQANYV
ncbi:hypothetical protein LCGC14_2506740, partial [marine sediment metagenome]